MAAWMRRGSPARTPPGCPGEGSHGGRARRRLRHAARLLNRMMRRPFSGPYSRAGTFLQYRVDKVGKALLIVDGPRVRCVFSEYVTPVVFGGQPGGPLCAA